MRSGLRSASADRRPAKTHAAAPAPNASNARRFIPLKPSAATIAAAPAHSPSRLEDVAVEDRRDTEVGHVDQLRDIEVDRDADNRVSLFAAQPLLLDQKVDHVEGGIARGE